MKAIIVFLILAFTGCAHVISQEAMQDVNRDVSFEMVLKNPDAYIGETRNSPLERKNRQIRAVPVVLLGSLRSVGSMVGSLLESLPVSISTLLVPSSIGN